jgi:hypothetical protein
MQRRAVVCAFVGVDEDPTTVVSVANCGDPVVGRALALLLVPSRYEARLASLETSVKPERIEDTGVVLLAPTPGLSSARRESLTVILGKRAAAVGIPVLELTTLTG